MLHPEWNGDWKIKDRSGYIFRSGSLEIDKSRRYESEHRYVWEQARGPIPDGWIIHHVNGIKDDNRLENLVALPRDRHASDDIKNEAKMNRILQLEAEVTDLKKTIETYEKLFL